MAEIGGTAVRRSRGEFKAPQPRLRISSREVETNAPGSETLSSNWQRLEQDVCAARADVSALILSYLATPSPADHHHPRPKPPLISQAEFRAI